MSNKNTISYKIKFIGAVLVFIIISVLIATVYLNERKVKDGVIINIAGKQRMLTQMATKNIFYIYATRKIDFTELDFALNEFRENLHTLKSGNKDKKISPAPTYEIEEQLQKVTKLWDEFYKNVTNFKRLELNESNEKLIRETINEIYLINIPLLNEVDRVVTLYTNYSESKTQYLKSFQYGAALIILALIFYSFRELKRIQTHANMFLDSSKKLMEHDGSEPLKPIEVSGESEIIEATNTINCFVNKINSAMEYSTKAIEQSKNASQKLEEITSEFDEILDNLQDKTMYEQINKSEDIVIQSSEELIASAKKLQKLKEELDKLLGDCILKSNK